MRITDEKKQNAPMQTVLALGDIENDWDLYIIQTG